MLGVLSLVKVNTHFPTFKTNMPFSNIFLVFCLVFFFSFFFTHNRRASRRLEIRPKTLQCISVTVSLQFPAQL